MYAGRKWMVALVLVGVKAPRDGKTVFTEWIQS